MVAIDTNVLVRLLVRDDEAQYQRAVALLEREAIHIPDSVLLETEWVLRFAYRHRPAEVCAALRGVLGLPRVTIDQPTLIAQVIDWHEAGLDFADALHLAKSENHEGIDALCTFDEKFIQRAKGRSPCQVSAP